MKKHFARNYLCIFYDKCQHCHISLSPRPQPFEYFLSDFKLPTVSTVRDLGVLVDSRLTFRDHIKSVVSRGHLRAIHIIMALFSV